MTTADRSDSLSYAAARLYYAGELRLGWARDMELRDAARSLREAGEHTLACRAERAASPFGGGGVAELHREVCLLLREESVQ